MLDNIRLYWKKIQRARRIKRYRDKIPPYLKKDFGVELNYKIWITKGARFAASERNKICDNLSSQTVGYLSAYLIIVNLVTIYNVNFLYQLSSNQLGFTTTALSILILIYSQFENAKNHAIKAEKFHQCSLEIGELYNDLRMVKTFENVSNREVRIAQISEKYDVVLKKHENHSPIDLSAFTITKAKYFGLNWFEVKYIELKKYVSIKFKYHLMIYGPITLFIVFQLREGNLLKF